MNEYKLQREPLISPASLAAQQQSPTVAAKIATSIQLFPRRPIAQMIESAAATSVAKPAVGTLAVTAPQKLTVHRVNVGQPWQTEFVRNKLATAMPFSGLYFALGAFRLATTPQYAQTVATTMYECLIAAVNGQLQQTSEKNEVQRLTRIKTVLKRSGGNAHELSNWLSTLDWEYRTGGQPLTPDIVRHIQLVTGIAERCLATRLLESTLHAAILPSTDNLRALSLTRLMMADPVAGLVLLQKDVYGTLYSLVRALELFVELQLHMYSPQEEQRRMDCVKNITRSHLPAVETELKSRNQWELNQQALQRLRRAVLSESKGLILDVLNPLNEIGQWSNGLQPLQTLASIESAIVHCLWPKLFKAPSAPAPPPAPAPASAAVDVKANPLFAAMAGITQAALQPAVGAVAAASGAMYSGLTGRPVVPPKFAQPVVPLDAMDTRSGGGWRPFRPRIQPHRF